MINASRVWAAYEKARADLLAERSVDGHWEGSLSSSPLATATAISALILAEQQAAAIKLSGRQRMLSQRKISIM